MGYCEDVCSVLMAVVDLDLIFGQAVLVMGFMSTSIYEDDGVASRMAFLLLDTLFVVLAICYDYYSELIKKKCGCPPEYLTKKAAWRVKQAERVTNHMLIFACGFAYLYVFVVGAGGDLVGGFVMKILAASEGSFDLAMLVPIFIPYLDELLEKAFSSCWEKAAEHFLILKCRAMATATVLYGIVALIGMTVGGKMFGFCGLILVWVIFQGYISLYFRCFAGTEPADNAAGGCDNASADHLGKPSV